MGDAAADRDAGVINHVLGDFDAGENKIIAEVTNKVGEAILCLINESLTAAMNRYN